MPRVGRRSGRAGRGRWAASALLTLLAAGCVREAPPVAEPPPPEVGVSRPVVEEVTDFAEFTGRTASVTSIEVRARVSGYLDKALFQEGTDIEAGQPLFEIDPRPYEAALEKAQAVVQENDARLKRLGADYQRALSLVRSGAIGREDLDKIVGDRAETEASLQAARAQERLAQLNLDFTAIKAPISGRVGRRQVDPGNLVKADDTVLTTIVSTHAVHVYFDVDEGTLLELKRLVEEGKMKSPVEHPLPVWMGLSDDADFPHEGRTDFIDISIDANTGTLRSRAYFENPAVNNAKLLSGGLFVRVRLPVGDPHPALLVPATALGTDQGQTFLYALNDRDEVTYRRVKVGAAHGTDRVILEGLTAGDRVVTQDLQKVRPGLKVVPVLGGASTVAQKKGPPAGTKEPPPPPQVLVSEPVHREVVDYEEFTGRTAASSGVAVRARVTGYLEKVLFKDGDKVKAGAPLFTIDPRPYQAELDRTKAVAQQAEARVKRVNGDYQRAASLVPRGAISREDFDKLASDRAEAEAILRAARADVKLAELNLEFTTVRAPLEGRISRRLIDPDNLVKADDTILTTIGAEDPIHVYFEVDERSLLKMRRLTREGKLQSPRETKLPVWMELADEDGFPRQGYIDFTDNKMDSATGTLRFRGEFSNKTTASQQPLSAGLFARVRLKMGEPREALLVTDRALGNKGGQKVVYVVTDRKVVYKKLDAKGKVEKEIDMGYAFEPRVVKLGPVHAGLRVIEEGLRPGDQVVVTGLQRLAMAMGVRPRLIPMPGPTTADRPAVVVRPQAEPHGAHN